MILHINIWTYIESYILLSQFSYLNYYMESNYFLLNLIHKFVFSTSIQ